MTAFDQAWRLVKTTTDPDSGVMVDGSNGIYMGQLIQQIASDQGWEWEAVGPGHEEYDDATDEAIEWLNENVAREGHSFGYHPDSGDFMYMPEEWFDDDLELDQVFDFSAMIDDARGKGDGWR